MEIEQEVGICGELGDDRNKAFYFRPQGGAAVKDVTQSGFDKADVVNKLWRLVWSGLWLLWFWEFIGDFRGPFFSSADRLERKRRVHGFRNETENWGLKRTQKRKRMGE